MAKKYIKKAISYSIAGSLGLTIMAGLHGCGEEEEPKKNPNGSISEATKAQQNYFLTIKQTAKDPDAYIVEEKVRTSGATKAILKDMDGKETVLTEEELKKLAATEAKKVDEGTSNLTKEPQASSPGLSMGETILAAAAGALIGGMIANKLAQNSNFRQNQAQQGRRTSSFQQSRRNSSRSSSSAKPKSGLVGKNNKPSSSSSSSRGSSSSVGG